MLHRQGHATVNFYVKIISFQRSFSIFFYTFLFSVILISYWGPEILIYNNNLNNRNTYHNIHSHLLRPFTIAVPWSNGGARTYLYSILIIECQNCLKLHRSNKKTHFCRSKRTQNKFQNKDDNSSKSHYHWNWKQFRIRGKLVWKHQKLTFRPPGQKIPC